MVRLESAPRVNLICSERDARVALRVTVISCYYVFDFPAYFGINGEGKNPVEHKKSKQGVVRVHPNFRSFR